MNRYFIFFLAIAVAGLTTLVSRSFRVSQVPNGGVTSCNTCHSSGGGTPRNPFGKTVENYFLTQAGGSGNVRWSPLLASLDSDGDGVSNGEELQDPFGLFSPGDSQPGNQNLVSAPGFPNSTPYKTATINFKEMFPHNNQTLYLMLVDHFTNNVVYRTSTKITDSFALEIPKLLAGHSYSVNFFADHNGNSIYDTPPADHAWTLAITDVKDDVSLNFAHNPFFVNIPWNYSVNLNLSGFTPHVGQLLGVKVVDENGLEVIRKRLEQIPSDVVNLDLNGLEFNKNYKMQFFADLNKNGFYDAPPTDHAWEVEFNTASGNAEVDFNHNTNFTDINWSNSFTLNVLDLSPHVGQNFYIRMLNDNGVEVSRKKVKVEEAAFTISLPGIVRNSNYRIDFFADLNGNGKYDSPPTDHAWRIEFTSENFNVVENFTHNTDFTDIKWEDVTDLQSESSIANKYLLHQNYPNPFNPSTAIEFSIPEAAHVELTVYNSLGQSIATLVNSFKTAGIYKATFDASNLSSGLYIYRIRANSFVSTKKMVLIK